MIELLKSIFLGMIEGITEFLPVSSTGHLIIFQNIIHFRNYSSNFIQTYTYVIQLGAILAIIALYRKKIVATLTNFLPNNSITYEKSGFCFWFYIALACIPGTIVELTIGNYVEQYLFYPVPVSITLILGGFF